MSDDGINRPLPPPENPFLRTMPLALTVRLLGVSRQVRRARPGSAKPLKDDEEFSVEDTVNASEDDMVRVSKRILECPEYEGVRRLAGEARGWLKRRQVPGGRMLFRAGTYPIPLAWVDEADRTMREFAVEFRKRCRAFYEVYERRVEESKKRLKAQVVLGHDYDLAEDQDYPPLEKVKQEFDFRHEWISFGPSPTLAGLNKEIYDREVRRIQEQCGTAAEEVRLALRELFQKAVGSLMEALTPGPEGKRKAVKEAHVANLREFIDGFEAMNITDDASMKEVVNKARAVLDGADLKALQGSDAVRKITAARVGEVKKLADKLVVEAPSRVFRDLPD